MNKMKNGKRSDPVKIQLSKQYYMKKKLPGILPSF